MKRGEQAPTCEHRPCALRLHACCAVATLMLGLLGSTIAHAEDLGTLARLEVLLDARIADATCQELPPTPNPEGPSESSAQCTNTYDGIQIDAIRTAAGRIVWLDYTGAWKRGAAGPAQWNAMLETLERAFGEANGPRAHCRLWKLHDGVVRAALLGSGDGDDGVIRLLRITVTGADTHDALGC